MPCGKLRSMNYSGPGEYSISLEFEPSGGIFSPDKRPLKSWKLETIRENEEDLVFGDSFLRTLMREGFYMWEVYSIPVSIFDDSLRFRSFYEDVSLNYDYTKALYLLGKSSQTEEGFLSKQIFEREVEYLNSNKEEIIKKNSHISYEGGKVQYIMYPEAYILELVELGLDKDYLLLLEDFLVPDYNNFTFSFDFNKEPLLLTESEVYSVEYLDLIRYSDYYWIFKEHGREELADYSHSKMVEIYNNSGFVAYGLCSLGYSDNTLFGSEELKKKLEVIFSTDKKELVEGNIYELLMCDMYAKKNELNIEGLDNAISEALRLQMIEVDNSYFIVRGLSSKGTDLETPSAIIKYNFIDNLMYLLYEE
jgi:hypothetical protein